jgi:hypothetical protein
MELIFDEHCVLKKIFLPKTCGSFAEGKANVLLIKFLDLTRKIVFSEKIFYQYL